MQEGPDKTPPVSASLVRLERMRVFPHGYSVRPCGAFRARGRVHRDPSCAYELLY